MKRIALIGFVIALVVVPAFAHAGSKTQKVEGSVVAPAYYPDGSCYPGLTRRLALLTNEAVNGVTGFFFDVDPATWGKRFVLEPTGGHARIDLDIFFYWDFGSIDPLAAPPTISYADRDESGEKGTVPAGVKKAVVCMYIDANEDPPAGVAATFVYTAVKRGSR